MRLIGIAAAAAALLLPVTGPAQDKAAPGEPIADEAGTALLEIAPVRVQLLGDERATAITVRNLDNQTVVLQSRAFDWSQAGGSERFTPSTILLASPPMVALRPGQAQLIRLAVGGLSAASGEHAFRLVIDRIPDGRSDPDARTRTAIRVQIPVFVTPSMRDRALLKWKANRTGADLVLTARNDGVRHERITGMRVSGAVGALGDPLDGYVLGQASRSWTIANVPAATPWVRIRGEGDYGPIEAEVSVEP
jgi:fimbrial chaperone protein